MWSSRRICCISKNTWRIWRTPWTRTLASPTDAYRCSGVHGDELTERFVDALRARG